MLNPTHFAGKIILNPISSPRISHERACQCPSSHSRDAMVPNASHTSTAAYTVAVTPSSVLPSRDFSCSVSSNHRLHNRFIFSISSCVQASIVSCSRLRKRKGGQHAQDLAKQLCSYDNYNRARRSCCPPVATPGTLDGGERHVTRNESKSTGYRIEHMTMGMCMVS